MSNVPQRSATHGGDDEDDDRVIGVRLPTHLIERLDAHVSRMAEAQPGVSFKRADAIRTLLLLALDQVR